MCSHLLLQCKEVHRPRKCSRAHDGLSIRAFATRNFVLLVLLVVLLTTSCGVTMLIFHQAVGS